MILNKFHTVKVGVETHIGKGGVDPATGKYEQPLVTFCGIENLKFSKPQSPLQLSKRVLVCHRCQSEATWLAISYLAGSR